MKQLPVIGTAIDAYTFVWENRRDFLLLAFLPIVIGAGLSGIRGLAPWL